MKSSQDLYPRISIVFVAMVVALGLTPIMRGQETQIPGGPTPDANATIWHGDGVPSDWTHRHVIYSHPGTADEAMQNGKYDRWLKITNDPRYVLQQLKRSGAGPNIAAAREYLRSDTEAAPILEENGDNEITTEDLAPKNAENFPDGVLPRGLTRVTIPQSQQSEYLAEIPKASFRPIRKRAKNLIEKDWSETLGSSGSTGMGNFPATFTHTSASCASDFAVYNTGLTGSSSQASIVAYNQLYSGCTPRPSVYWAFDTGGTIQTSVTLSIDGTQLAFVQTDNSTGHADLVVLKWAASSGTLTSPTVLSSNSSYPNCTAPCMIVIPFSGGPTDTYSSLYVDYTSGTAYAGDDAGAMHKFTDVFLSGTPAESTSPWPVTLNSSTDAALGSPVYDSVSGKIFVGDYLANVSSKCQPGIETTEGQCGYLYSILASSGTGVVQSAQLDYNFGIYDSPIVDSSAGEVYVFVGADNSTSCSSGPCAAVHQFSVSFTSGATGIEATVGAGYQILMSGSFDNQYFTSSGLPTGHLYVVGGTGPQNNTLYAITITSNTMTSGPATAGPQVAANYTNGLEAAGLQVTEFCNNGSNACTATQGTDYLFLSVLAFGASPCPGQSATVGCIMGFTAPTTGTIASDATPNGTLQEAGGTSGIVIDNGASGASSIYFSTLANQTCATSGGTGGCAVSATQGALQ